jgi:predicted dienelactone hydrolase
MKLRACCRSTMRMRLVGCTAIVAVGALGGAAPASAAEHPVGHDVRTMVVPGSATGEPRRVDVHLWYPADPATVGARPKTVYRSALQGVAVPAGFLPLRWTVEAEVAREDAAIDPAGTAFPVIVFSHGNTNDPIDYAHTLEGIAAAGFVVAAPSHTNNTQDDARIDLYNTLSGATPIACNDGRAGPCSRTNVPFSMADRTRDLSAVLDAVPGWFGTRADVTHAGALGHSRGTLSVLAAAGGSAAPAAGVPCSADPVRCWPVTADPRFLAVMGMAIGQQPISLGVDYKAIRVPTLLVSAENDLMSPPSVSENAFKALGSTDRRLVSIEDAVHRSFDSTYCDQMQAAGRLAAANLDTALLDKHTFDRIVVSPNSGWGIDFCSFASFDGIVDLTRTASGGFTPTADNVPRGLDTDEVKEQMVELAVEFFGTRLPASASGAVGGTVPATLALTLGAPASFGMFAPGVERSYDASTTATVTSTAGSALLSVSDPSAVATGRLVNGSFALDQPLQVRANTGVFAPLGTAPLLTYTGPVSNGAATIGFRQNLASTQALRTGTYAKTLTFTLSTEAP